MSGQGEWFPKAETDITTTCVAYLSLDEFESGFCQNDEEFEQRLQINKPYDYAAHNWGYHTCAVSTWCQRLMSFLGISAQAEALIQALIAVINRTIQLNSGCNLISCTAKEAFFIVELAGSIQGLCAVVIEEVLFPPTRSSRTLRPKPR